MDLDQLEIRFAEPGDAIILFRVTLDELPPGLQEFEDQIYAGKVILAEVANVPIGHLCFNYRDWGERQRPEITDVFVTELARRQGVSRALLNFLQDHLRQQGYSVVFGFVSDQDTNFINWFEWMDFFLFMQMGTLDAESAQDENILDQIASGERPPYQPGTGRIIFRKDF